jgi:hypothetical protein
VRHRYGPKGLTEKRFSREGNAQRSNAVNIGQNVVNKSMNNYVFTYVGPKHKGYNVLIDSGSTLSITTSKMVEREGLQLLPLQSLDTRTLRVANNEVLEVIGKVLLDVYIEDVQIFVMCFVVNTLSTSILFGCDMFAQYNAVIDFKRGEFSLLNGRLNLPLTHGMRANTVAYVKQEVTIPPRTEAEINCKLGGY